MANGWSTFETWKIWHELFSYLTLEDLEPDLPIQSEWCLNYAEVVLELGEIEGIAPFRSFKDSIVLSWLTKVNWSEIAEALNDELNGSSITT